MGAEAPYLGTKPLLGPIMIYGAHLNKNKNNQWFIILYEHNTKILLFNYLAHNDTWCIIKQMTRINNGS